MFFFPIKALPATFFGPRSLGFTTTNLGNFGPLGYGGIGGMRIGSIGPIHYGYIGGMHTDPFLGAPNRNAEDEEFPGTTDTLSEDEYEQDFIGNPMEQNWQEMNDESNFVGMEPDEQEMVNIFDKIKIRFHQSRKILSWNWDHRCLNTQEHL